MLARVKGHFSETDVDVQSHDDFLFSLGKKHFPKSLRWSCPCPSSIQLMSERKRLLDDEVGTCFKHGEISVGLIYPNSYFVGMSNLGFQTMYDRLNRIPDVSCQRIFLSQPPLSLERGNLLSDFEILAFSISFELDYLNVLKMLDPVGIPLHSSDRDDSHPLILAGGFAPSSNPEPLAMFIDAFLIGEGEEVITEFMNIYRTLRGKLRRRELLRELTQVQGVYVPSTEEKQPVKRRWVKNLDDFDTASCILTPNTEFGDMFLIELTRGCPRQCRFCLAGSVCKPFRFRTPERVLHLVQKGLKMRKKIGLVSLEITSYPYLDKVLSEILNMGGIVSLSSFRPGRWQNEVIKALKKSGQETIAIAPETGSERLRRVIGKDVSEEEVLEQVKVAAANGVKHIKLYFLIGLPTETDTDVQALLELVRKVKKVAAPRITVSVNPFVPKPATPFQWTPMEEASVLSSRLRMIRRELGRIGGVNLIHESVKWSLWQGILARGDRKVGEVIENTYRIGDWRKAFREVGIDPEFYLERVRGKEETFPWDHLIQGYDKNVLYEEYIKATTPDLIMRLS